MVGTLLLVTMAGASGGGAAQSPASPGVGPASLDGLAAAQGNPATGLLSEQPVGQRETVDRGANGGSQVADSQEEVEREENEGEEEEGASILGDWWGLGGEAREAPYVGLVELGIVVLTIGLGGYLLGKRASAVPVRYRRHLLPVHEWSMLLGTALTAPHFFAVEEWEGTGFAVGGLLAIEVASGLYGRHLHRHVIRLGRGGESPGILGGFLSLTKRTLFSRWRWIHRSLTVLTVLVLVVHVVTAIGD